jgi:hypothetical protein
MTVQNQLSEGIIMPMSFPTFESLRNCATGRNFRQPLKDETEQQYRQALYNFMLHVDSVEASEIKSGVGWDQQDPSSILSSFFLGRGTKSPLYVWSLAVVIVEHPIVKLETIVNERGAHKLVLEIDSEVQHQYDLDDESLEYRQLLAKYGDKVKFKRVLTIEQPKGFEGLDYKNVVGNYIDLWARKSNGEQFIIIPSKSYAISLATVEQLASFTSEGQLDLVEPEYSKD